MKIMIPFLLFALFFTDVQAQEPLPQGKPRGIDVNLDPLLKGKIAGLNILSTDTSAKGIRVCLDCRPKSINSDLQPLLVIDGQRVALGQLKSLNPNDIAIVRVLKAGEAILEYGHDGKNGAVFVATKRYLEQRFQGRMGCQGIRDTVPGKITRPVTAKPFTISEERLIVVDGIPVQNNDKKMLPATGNIERVDIIRAEDLLKNSNIILCSPPRDVVLITTKPVPVRTQVTNRLNGLPVPNASVRVQFKQKNSRHKVIIADSAGYFTMENGWLEKIGAITVTSIGYREQLLLHNDLQQAKGMICMEPAVQTGDTAFVVVDAYRRRVSCGYTITTIRRNKKRSQPKTEVQPGNLFPNPVKRGAQLTIEWDGVIDRQMEIVLSTVNGQPVLETKHAAGKAAQRTYLQIPANLTAGIYMLYARSATGELLLCRRVVVE